LCSLIVLLLWMMMMIVVFILFRDIIHFSQVTFLHKLFVLFFCLHSNFKVCFKLLKRREFSFLLFEIVFGIQRHSIFFVHFRCTLNDLTLTHYIVRHLFCSNIVIVVVAELQ
jgi:hypothetical protein